MAGKSIRSKTKKKKGNVRGHMCGSDEYPPDGRFTHIAAALVPTTSFIAVPRTPPPQDADPEYTTVPAASGLLSSTMLGRLFATHDLDDTHDQDTSLEDYADPRNLTLEDRDRMATPRDSAELPYNYNSNYDVATGDYATVRYDDEDEGRYSSTERIERYPIERRTDSGPIYAVPEKRITSQSRIDDESLPRPFPSVLEASTSREQVAAEEYMVAERAPRKAESGLSMSALNAFDAVITPQKSALSQSAPGPSRTPRDDSPRKAETPRTAEFRRQNDVLIKRQEELERRLVQHEDKQSKLFEHLERTGGSRPSPEQSMEREQLIDQQATLTDHTLHDQEDLIKTLQDRIVNLESEKVEHEDMNTELLGEIDAFRKYVREREGGAAGEVQESIFVRRQLGDLKDENETLKKAIGRLNQDLSRYQAKYRNIDPVNKNLVGLPSKGPVPSWLINTKYLAPLFLSYDDQFKEKDDLIRQYEEEMETFTHRMEEIVKENERLHIRLEQTDANGPFSVTEWNQLQEQAKLVLEENQLLLEQLDIQNEKTKQMNSAHVHEISKLSKRIVLLESENQDSHNALKEIKGKCADMSAQMQSSVIETDLKMTLPEHRNVVSEIKKKMEGTNRSHQEELTTLTSRLDSVQSENRNLNLKLSDLQSDKDKTDVEFQSLKRSYKKTQKKSLVLQRVLEEFYDQESSAQHYLSSVVKVAEQTAVERDTYAQLIREQEGERKRSMKEMVEGTVVIERMEQKLKSYKVNATRKLMSVMEKMKDQEQLFERKKMEYELEIRHLKAMVSDKEGLVDVARHEKKLVEEELGSMWQKAGKDNQRMRDSMERTFQKLRQHKQTEARWNQDEEIKELLGYQNADTL